MALHLASRLFERGLSTLRTALDLITRARALADEGWRIARAAALAARDEAARQRTPATKPPAKRPPRVERPAPIEEPRPAHIEAPDTLTATPREMRRARNRRDRAHPEQPLRGDATSFEAAATRDEAGRVRTAPNGRARTRKSRGAGGAAAKVRLQDVARGAKPETH